MIICSDYYSRFLGGLQGESEFFAKNLQMRKNPAEMEKKYFFNTV